MLTGISGSKHVQSTAMTRFFNSSMAVSVSGSAGTRSTGTLAAGVLASMVADGGGTGWSSGCAACDCKRDRPILEYSGFMGAHRASSRGDASPWFFYEGLQTFPGKRALPRLPGIAPRVEEEHTDLLGTQGKGSPLSTPRPSRGGQLDEQQKKPGRNRPNQGCRRFCNFLKSGRRRESVGCQSAGSGSRASTRL